MREYLRNDCAELSYSTVLKGKVYYMPHHAVYKQEKITTKIRIVFDASVHSFEHLSLNESLYLGTRIIACIIKFQIWSYWYCSR